jgi:hypothetical protein
LRRDWVGFECTSVRNQIHGDKIRRFWRVILGVNGFTGITSGRYSGIDTD